MAYAPQGYYLGSPSWLFGGEGTFDFFWPRFFDDNSGPPLPYGSLGAQIGNDYSLDATIAGFNPISWWKLNETTGTNVIDYGATANNGTLSGSGTTLGGAGPGNFPGDTCYTFNGSGYVAVTENANYEFGTTESFSVACWFKTTAPYTSGTIGGLIGKGAYTGGDPGFLLDIQEGGSGGCVDWQLYDGTNNPDMSSAEPPVATAYNDGGWHLAVGVCDRTNEIMQLYVDGYSVAPSVSISGLGSISSVGNPVTLASQTGGNDPYTGSLTMCAILPGALTAVQVAQLWAASLPYMGMITTANLIPAHPLASNIAMNLAVTSDAEPSGTSKPLAATPSMSLAVVAGNTQAATLNSTPSMSLAVVAGNTEKSALVSAISMNLAVVAGNSEKATLNSAVSSSLNVVAGNQAQLPLASAVAPSLSVVAGNAETAQVAAAIGSSLSVTAANVESATLATSISSSLAVTADLESGSATNVASAVSMHLTVVVGNSEAATLATAVSPSLAVVAGNTESVALSTAIACLTFWDNYVATLAPFNWYKMNETSGTTVLDYGSGNHTMSINGSGTTLSNTGAIVNNPAETAYVMNGSGVLAGAAANPNPGTASFSWGVWFNTTQVTYLDLMGKYFSGSEAGYYIQLPTTHHLVTAISDGTNTATAVSTSTYNDGFWHFVFAVVDRTAQTLNLYVDGLLQAQTPCGSVGSLTNAGAVPRIGATQAGINAITGGLTQGLVFLTALTAAQVQALYQSSTFGSMSVVAPNQEQAALASAISPSMAVVAGNSESAQVATAISPSLVVTATESALLPIASSISPSLVVTAANKEASALASAVSMNLSVTAANKETSALMSAIAMNLAVTAANQEQAALASAIVMNLAVTAANTEKGAIATAISMNLGVTAALNQAGTVNIASAITMNLAVTANNTEKAPLAVAIAMSLAVTAANKETSALVSAISAMLVVTANNTEKAKLASAIAAAQLVTASTLAEVAITTTMAPHLAVTAANEQEIPLASAISNSLTVTAGNVEMTSLSTASNSALGVTANLQILNPHFFLTTAIQMSLGVAAALSSRIDINFGEDSFSTVVQPALMFQQQSPAMAVQPAMGGAGQSFSVVVQPAIGGRKPGTS